MRKSRIERLLKRVERYEESQIEALLEQVEVRSKWKNKCRDIKADEPGDGRIVRKRIRDD